MYAWIIKCRFLQFIIQSTSIVLHAFFSPNALNGAAAAADGGDALGGWGMAVHVYDITIKCSARFAWLFVAVAVNMYSKIVLHKIINCISKHFFPE